MDLLAFREPRLQLSLSPSLSLACLLAGRLGAGTQGPPTLRSRTTPVSFFLSPGLQTRVAPRPLITPLFLSEGMKARGNPPLSLSLSLSLPGKRSRAIQLYSARPCSSRGLMVPPTGNCHRGLGFTRKVFFNTVKGKARRSPSRAHAPWSSLSQVQLLHLQMRASVQKLLNPPLR